MAIYGYTWADERPPANEEAVLTAAGAVRVFRDAAGGAGSDRRELTQALRLLRSGDILMVRRLNRLAGSTRDLLRILDTIANSGAGFRSLEEAWADTTQPQGGGVVGAIGGLAEFERERLRARTADGRAKAVARGVPLGRPPKLSARRGREALKALVGGAATQAELARRLHVSQSTISRLAHKAQRRQLDEKTRGAARAFLRRLEGKCPIKAAFVFGSRARGDFRSDSDADVAVILRGDVGDRYKTSAEMADAAFDALMETGVVIDPLPLWESEMRFPERFSNPKLIENIKREGQPP